MSYVNRRYRVTDGRIEKSWDGTMEPDWFSTKAEAWADWQGRMATRRPGPVFTSSSVWQNEIKDAELTNFENVPCDYAKWTVPKLRHEIKVRLGKGPRIGVKKAEMVKTLEDADTAAAVIVVPTKADADMQQVASAAPDTVWQTTTE